MPLHIFEPRYKLMIRRCQEHRRAFGVVLARSGGIARVGCTAEIVNVTKQHADGRMNILTIGQTPYRIEDVFEDEPYWEGTIEYLKDDASPVSPEIQRRLQALFEQCHTLVFGRSPMSTVASAGTSLAFYFASELPLDVDCHQELLETRVESDRQSQLLGRLNQWLPQLTYLNCVRGKARGNGHGLR